MRAAFGVLAALDFTAPPLTFLLLVVVMPDFVAPGLVCRRTPLVALSARAVAGLAPGDFEGRTMTALPSSSSSA